MMVKVGEKQRKRDRGRRGVHLTDSLEMKHEPDGRSRLVCVWETILMVVESESVTVNTEGCIIV